MRVAYVTTDPGVPAFGVKGCSVHVQEGMRALQARGAHVTLFTPRLGGTPPPELARASVMELPPRSGATTAARETSSLVRNPATARALRQEGPFDLVYERYALWSHAAMAWGRKLGVPTVLEVNSPLIEEQNTHRGLVNVRGALETSRRAFAHADVMVAVSDAVANWLDGFPEARGRIHVVPNGVDVERFRPGLMPKEAAPKGAFVVGFVGSLKPWHGLATLAEAFARLHQLAPDVHLLIVGEGPERESLQADLERLGVADAATLTGAVAPVDVPRWMAAMDVAVAPYTDATGCYFSPLKVFEAMAAGIPVVASRAGQVADVIEDGATGRLVPPGDAVALADALDALRRDPPASGTLAAAARQLVVRHHTWLAVFGQVLELAGLHQPSEVA
ncbi:MAG: glycosyltransferase family 4 protein [Rubricoccaceae bacterium]